jgi:hypothetical protein
MFWSFIICSTILLYARSRICNPYDYDNPISYKSIGEQWHERHNAAAGLNELKETILAGAVFWLLFCLIEHTLYGISHGHQSLIGRTWHRHQWFELSTLAAAVIGVLSPLALAAKSYYMLGYEKGVDEGYDAGFKHGMNAKERPPD